MLNIVIIIIQHTQEEITITGKTLQEIMDIETDGYKYIMLIP